MDKKVTLIIATLITIITTIILCVLISNTNKNNIDDTIESNNTFIEGESNMNEDIKINIIINEETYTATLEDSETTKEFLNRLPLTITMNELNGNEKYYYFDEQLPNNSSKVNNISLGDIMLYGSDCLVIFYESFNTPYSYTRIGKIDEPQQLKENLGGGNIKVLFTK